MDLQLPTSNCPGCGASLDAAMRPRDAAAGPVPGDLTVCAYCGVALLFDETLHQRALTIAEFAALPDATRRALSDAAFIVMMFKLYGAPKC